MADSYLLAVGSYDMVVVASGGKASVYHFRFAGRIGGEFVQFSPAIIHEPLAVGCPVWSFDTVGEFFDYGAPAVCYVQYFQYAGYVVLLGGCERRESPLRESYNRFS